MGDIRHKLMLAYIKNVDGCQISFTHNIKKTSPPGITERDLKQTAKQDIPNFGIPPLTQVTDTKLSEEIIKMLIPGKLFLQHPFLRKDKNQKIQNLLIKRPKDLHQGGPYVLALSNY